MLEDDFPCEGCIYGPARLNFFPILCFYSLAVVTNDHRADPDINRMLGQTLNTPHTHTEHDKHEKQGGEEDEEIPVKARPWNSELERPRLM